MIITIAGCFVCCFLIGYICGAAMQNSAWEKAYAQICAKWEKNYKELADEYCEYIKKRNGL